ncbi:MAG: SH3 domain-containing protein [Lachnospiraceae bacterium]|nr:SH3 domain-containing protein [Lachnospiraceae bacterium]
MENWSKKFSKVLTAAGISAIVAVSSLVMPIEASAARTVTDNVMIRNDATTEAGIIGSLNEGDEVQILDVLQSADGYAWYYIQLDNGATGYVRSDLIEADDSELAAFRDKEQEVTEDTAEEEPAEEENAGTEEAAPEENEPAETESAPAQEAPAAASAGTEGYDATKDPNANYRAGYEQEADGTVTWYVYNDDNGSKVRISDLQAQESAAETGKGGPGIWRTLAIVFGILAAALAAFVLFLLKSIRDGRSKTTRGRALEAAAAARDDEDEEEEEEFFFEDDEPAEDGIESDETAAEEPSGTPEETDTDTEEVNAPAPAADNAGTPDSTITMEVPEVAEPTEIPAEEIEAAIAATTAQLEENISKDEAAQTEETADEEIIEEESSEVVEEEPEEEYEEEFEEDDYEDEDYEDEDYEEDEEDAESEEPFEEDEEYEDEDYEDEEESESRTARRSAAKGGFFGFLKKMFGSESAEDAEDPDEGGDFDDYEDEPEDHEFDEFKEYPEDIDLLPREETEESDYLEEDDYSEEGEVRDDSERGRLSMQRVMKNVSYKDDESDYYREGDPNDLSDSLFEDDDDMEYSFISSRKK